MRAVSRNGSLVIGAHIHNDTRKPVYPYKTGK